MRIKGFHRALGLAFAAFLSLGPLAKAKEVQEIREESAYSEEKNTINLNVNPGQAKATSFRITGLEKTASSIDEGESFISSILLRNDSKRDLPLTITVKTQDPIEVSEGKNEVDTYIKKGEKLLLEIPMKAKENLDKGSYPLTLEVKDKDLGNSISLLSSINIIDQKAVENIDQVKGLRDLLNALEEGRISIITEEVPIKNEGERDLKEKDRNKLSKIEEEGEAKMPISQAKEENPANSNDQVAKEKVDQGQELEGQEKEANVNQISGEPVKNIPKLIIENYSLDPKMPEAGKEFTLNLSFYNTNSEYSVRNIKISLTNESTSQGPDGQTVEGGSVFTPVNSSNTFYIDKIMPKKSAAKEIRMSVVPNAQAQNYIMTASFEYEDKRGNQYTATEIIGIPVVQVAKIDCSEVSLEEATVGNPSSVDLDFFNTGKDNLSNMMVSINGEGFSVEGSADYFVGNFTPGASDHYSASIIPTGEGEFKGNVILTYETSTGKAERIEKAFKGSAMAQSEVMTDEKGNPIDEMGEDENGGRAFLPWLIAAIIIIVLIVLFIQRRKKKNKDDQDLSL